MSRRRVGALLAALSGVLFLANGSRALAQDDLPTPPRPGEGPTRAQTSVQRTSATSAQRYRVQYRPSAGNNWQDYLETRNRPKADSVAKELTDSGYHAQVVNDTTPTPQPYPDQADTSASNYYPTSNFSSDYNTNIVPGGNYGYNSWAGWNPGYRHYWYPGYANNGGSYWHTGWWRGHGWNSGWNRGNHWHDGWNHSHRSFNHSHTNRSTHDAHHERHETNAHHGYHNHANTAGHHMAGHHAAAHHATNHGADGHHGTGHFPSGARNGGRRAGNHAAGGHAFRGGRGGAGRGNSAGRHAAGHHAGHLDP